jgi:endonuclease/exonuclease/phosphatase family metal-dependent hydrolase
MRYFFGFICVLALGVMGCGETSGTGGSGGTAGSRGEPVEVRIDTYNVGLAGPIKILPQYDEELRQPLGQAIAEAETDIICLQELWTEADKEMLRDDVIATFPYVWWFTTDIDTEVDDPRDQNGEVPPAATTVPCSPDVEVSEGVTLADQMNDTIDCVRDACSTVPGSDEGRLTSLPCALDACTATSAVLLLGTPEQQRCYSCIRTQLEPFGVMRERCLTVVNQVFGFRGQNGMMLLSKYPLRNESAWVLPSTGTKRIVLSATAELPNGGELDLHCNHLINTPDSITSPYIGPYGDGETGAAGWEAEQFLSARRLIERVESTSRDRPAIVLGDLNTGHAYAEQEVFEEVPWTLDLLQEFFTPAYTEDYVPICTYCNTNPLNGFDPERSRWIDHILLYNLPDEVVKATERTFDNDEAVDVGDGVKVSLSDHYGMRSVIEVR